MSLFSNAHLLKAEIQSVANDWIEPAAFCPMIALFEKEWAAITLSKNCESLELA